MVSVFYPDPRAAKEMGELTKRWQCTIFLSTATFLRFYLRRCEAEDFRSVRLMVCGAEKLPVSLAEEFRARFGVLPYEGYGCTELSPVVSANLPDFAQGTTTQRANTFGTVGQPIPGVVVKAFHPETNEPLAVGQEGMLCVKGANVMLGYLHQPEKTAQVIRNGWYTTGDMGFITPEGFITITGRLSRFAKIAGEMVPLERLEEELHNVLGFQGDRLVAVAAVPDSKRGERLVILHLPEVRAKLREALDSLRKRGLPNLWIPDERDAHNVDSFPVLGSGKLDLRGLTELAKRLAPAA
jgi:acyl-[acyl-carrier-protein]-phospholipid O-acyltransferase/long-chain-fatty-acid--[acyl-carrier-protein] ligase